MKRLERWKPLIEDARDEQHVLVLLRDFLALYTPQELASLPPGCRVAQVAGGNDVAAWATTLAREERVFEGDAATALLLAQLSEVFAEASNRLAALSLEARLMRPRGTDPLS